jgi:hypothetical protein
MGLFREILESVVPTDKDTPIINGPDARWDTWTDEDEAWLHHELANLGWEQIQDLYEPDELEPCDCPEGECTCCHCDDDCDCENVHEALSYQGRVKKKLAAQKSKVRRAAARRLSLKRASGPAALKKRAVLAAQRLTKKRFGKTAGNTDRRRVEKQVSKSVVSHVAQRLQARVRTLEQKRLSKAKK